MNNRIICRDLTRNKAVSLTMVLFIAAAAMLIALAAILGVNLLGAIDRLMLEAKTPHFMQMHSGALDRAELLAFAKENGNVSDYQALEFLNVDGSQIVLGENPLAGSLQDNGFCTQSERFDFLLDLDGRPIRPKPGELYAPVCYLKDGTAKAGDRALVGGETFVVAGFVRDSQMNSTLASSKRFLVSEEDYRRLKPLGNVEHLIEFRLHDMSGLSAFETAYSAAGLPANGPTLTWPLFRMVSAISDGMMIAVIVLIGVLVILIALLCVRFTLLAKLEEDYREIGVMKALGMRACDIRKLYLALYAAIAGMGSALGLSLALLLAGPMQKSIRLNLGDGGAHGLALALGTAGVALVFLVILLYVGWSLRRFRGISAVQAIRFGAAREPSQRLGGIRLSENRLLPINLFLGIKDVLERKRLYATMLAVVVLASFIMIVPQNLYHTISGDGFAAYLGVGGCDLRLDIQQVSGLDAKTARIRETMENDPELASYAVFTTKAFPILLDSGATEHIKVELGDHSVFPVQYASGAAPVSGDEIALSAINAKELGKGVGDPVTLITSAGEKRLTVCGVYSDITNGGKTAKAVFSDATTKTAWSMACATLADPARLNGKIAEYRALFPYAKGSGISEYMAQTFGQTLRSVRTASLVAAIVAAAITLLVTLLFMKLLAAKDRYSIAVMRSVGFTGRDISRQYAWRAVLVLAAGIGLGTVLAGTLGKKLSGLAFSSLGAAVFHFTANPLSNYLLSPLAMLLSALIATAWGTCRAGAGNLYESIKE